MCDIRDDSNALELECTVAATQEQPGATTHVQRSELAHIKRNQQLDE